MPPKIEVLPDALLAPLAGTLSVMSQELRAAVLMAQGQIAQSEEAFSRAAASEQSLGYREPPIYIRPVRESEGASRLAARDWSGARTAFQTALVERPRSGFALYGLAQCSEQAGDKAGAIAAYTEFLRAWRDADRSLPQVMHAREYVAGQGR
jgi:tetratricopeptide (TPR) repeat protein